MKAGSLSLRLALAVGVLGLLQAAAVLAFSYFTLANELEDQQRTVLRDKAEHARHLASKLADGEALRASATQFAELVAGHEELHLVVAREGAETPWVSFSPEAAESLQRLRRDTWGSDAFLEWQTRRQGMPMLSLATAAQTRDGTSYAIALSANRSEDMRLLKRLLLTSLGAAPVALALVSLGAVALVRLGLRPLDRFSRAAAHISAHDLSTRIAPAGLPAELGSLCTAFNAMLDRLDAGVRRLSEFSSDLAHELRTPISTLLGRTQVALSQPRSHDDLLEVLEGNVEELQRLSRLVDDMLFLAQADDARAVLSPETLDLGEEARKLAEFLELMAHERGIAIEVSGAAPVRADREHLRRAIINLVSNALRHARRGSSVRVSARLEAVEACVEVANEGTPIRPEHLPRLFDRFYRVDDSRNRESGGAGLGLAIVKAIMDLHRGSVQVQSDASGTRFTLRFPR